MTPERRKELRDKLNEAIEIRFVTNPDYGEWWPIAKDDLLSALDYIDQLEAETKTLRDALEWYGREENHRNEYGGWSANNKTPVNLDRGARARAALAPKQGETNENSI